MQPDAEMDDGVVLASGVADARGIARVLRERRRALGYTQTECAERAGVSPGWLSRFENGKATCPVNIVCDLAQALGVAFSLETAADLTADLVGPRSGGPRW